jgi:hypothetical protein
MDTNASTLDLFVSWCCLSLKLLYRFLLFVCRCLGKLLGVPSEELIKVSRESGVDGRIELRHGEEMRWKPSVVRESSVEVLAGRLEAGIGCHWGRAMVGG